MGELVCFYLLLSGIAVLYRVKYNLEKISTLDLEEEEREREREREREKEREREGAAWFIRATACDFQPFGILTNVDEPEQSPFMLRSSKCCSVSSLTVIECSSD